MPELEACDLAEFFGAGGPLARRLDGYELRPSQLQMAEAVKRSLLNQQHALIEAPTGTGKSIAYLLPAILSGKTVVVATANKSLQNQLYTKDIPFLAEVLGRPITAVVVKGRSNYICTHKWDRELREQRMFARFDREDDQAAYINQWLQATTTGDVDDLPFMLNSDLRPRVVSFPDDCLHTECRFYDDACWVNMMRDAAAGAQLLITNHHLLLNALELGFAGERILPPAPIYIIDEAHQLEQTATAVYETSVSDYSVEQLLARAVYRDHVDEEELDALRMRNTLAFQEIAHQSRENTYRLEGDLRGVLELATALHDLWGRMKQRNPYGAPASEGGDEQAEARRNYELGLEAIGSIVEKLKTIGTSRHDATFVRYVVRVFDRRSVSLEVHAAPIDPSGLLTRFLFHPENDDGPVARTVICTSATLATNGHFAHFKARCGLMEAGEEHVLPAVFDYPRQAVLYQPPLPTFKPSEAEGYYTAVSREIERLLEVSRGRALCLFTSWSGLQLVSDRLQRLDSPIIWPLRSQGDAPRNALIAWFLETPHSVLLATRSFWEGVDIPGDDLSLVVVDKLPFPTPGDPLHQARMKMIDDDGRSSFGDYMAPLMTLSLKQGFGRLIRRATDRGVVAILDERLTGKGYGRQTQRDLPPARLTRDFKEVYRFFQDGLGRPCDFALNVWVAADHGSEYRWRWQLLRLQDGRADADAGITEAQDAVHAQVHAAIVALRNLYQRVAKAGRGTNGFAVEVRVTPETEAMLAAGTLDATVAAAWRAEAAHWRALQVLPVPNDAPEKL